MFRTLSEKYDFVVVGGGLAGVCAAVAAARAGADTCLVQDRPVLGGNASSEVRVQTRGSASYHAYAREGGILQEIIATERWRNHKDVFENGWANSVWDLVLYDLVETTPGLTLHLNTAVEEVVTDDGRIRAVITRTANAETITRIEADLFADCTGDGIVAHLAGCRWLSGEEARAEYGEVHAPEVASADTMGSSIHFEVVDVGREVSFTPPEWTQTYDDDDFFYKGGRIPFDLRGGYWWIEIGKPWHTIYDNEKIRHELTRHALGVWDWMKNRNPELSAKLKTHALEWLGQVPGKRESRRILGLHLLTEPDLTRDEPFFDEVAYGGWNIDLHTPGGLLAATSEPTAAEGYVLTGKKSRAAYVGPFGIPLRSLIAKDCSNLFLAGRDVSATHAALGSIRVQATCAIMGQAVGTAAAVAHRRRTDAHEVVDHVDEVQQRLLRDGCFLPNYSNRDDGDLGKKVHKVTASSSARHSGAAPDDTWIHNGIRGHSRPGNHELSQRRGQWIPLGERHEGLTSIEVLLENTSSAAVHLDAWLIPVEHIWDYKIAGKTPLSSTSLVVPPGRHWVEWENPLPASLDQDAGSFVRLDLDAHEDIRWIPAGRPLPGAMSAFAMQEDRMRRYEDGLTMSFKVVPEQTSYGPDQVLTGESRPHQATNQWRSDPDAALPAWIQFDWEEPQQIDQIQLQFAGHLLREFDRYPSLSGDPQLVADYTIEIRTTNGWTEVVSERENFLPRRVHELESAVSTDAVRIMCHRTHGDPSAALYEARFYGPGH